MSNNSKSTYSVRTIKASGNIQPNLQPLKNIAKAEDSTSLDSSDQAVTTVIEAPYPALACKVVVSHSTIIPQCREAYRNNITGFGVGIKYKNDDSAVKETPEMKAEWDRLADIIKFFNLDMPIHKIWGHVIADREDSGNGYMEIIRNGAGEVVGGEYVEPEFIKLTKLGEPQSITMKRHGRDITRTKKFRKYIQQIGSQKVWFKEFGDPRMMSNRTGEYKEGLQNSEQANEILHLKIGMKAYGVPRWIGQSIHVEGSRLAENLNYNYFINGRHIPLAVLIKNGKLSADSFNDLQSYMNGAKGVDNAHSFLLFEIESDGTDIDLEGGKGKADIEIKEMAQLLQNDELFQNYIENSRKKVQSSFNLPDLYVGYTKDFNRATAETVMEVTEEQVFIPERDELSWLINNVLLADYDFKHVDAYFKAPDLSNPDDLMKVFSAARMAGGVTPNDGRAILSKVLKKDLENFTEEWADIPLEVQRMLIGNSAIPPLNTLIKSDDQMKNILKDVRDVLMEIQMSNK